MVKVDGLGFVSGITISALVILHCLKAGSKYLKRLKTPAYFFGDFSSSMAVYQDGAPCHRSRVANKWLEDNYISLLDCPVYFPGLDPIKNFWGILIRKLYANHRQLEDDSSLIECIFDARGNIS